MEQRSQALSRIVSTTQPISSWERAPLTLARGVGSWGLGVTRDRIANKEIPAVLQRDRLSVGGGAAVPGAEALDRDLDAGRERVLPNPRRSSCVGPPV